MSIAFLSSHFRVTAISISNPPWTSGDGLYFIAVTSPFMTTSLCSACQIYQLNSIEICPTVEGNMVPGNMVCPLPSNCKLVVFIVFLLQLNVSCCFKNGLNLCDTRDNLNYATYRTEIRVNYLYVNITFGKFALILWRVNFVRVINMLRYIPIIRYLITWNFRNTLISRFWGSHISQPPFAILRKSCILTLFNFAVLSETYFISLSILFNMSLNLIKLNQQCPNKQKRKWLCIWSGDGDEEDQNIITE